MRLLRALLRWLRSRYSHREKISVGDHMLVVLKREGEDAMD